MAELAVGLSKTVVAEALTKVQSAIDEDTKLRQKAQRDLVTITLEFEMMNSFLGVANEDRATNKLVMTWVRHVRELAYDLEDCVEFVVHLDDKRIFWRRLLPECIVGPLPLDQAVTEIEELKGRAKELSECYSRYSHICEPASKFVMLQQQQVSSSATGATSSNMLAEARDAARRQHGALGDLTQLITTNKDDDDDSKLQVISVWGTGGSLGTTSVIRKTYNDPEIRKNFACRVWVKVVHPFDPREFVRRFMAQVYASTCDKQGVDIGVHVLRKMNSWQERLLTEFMQEVNTKTYLVVLENLTDMADWDAVRTFLPDVENGSRIIVSTQNFEVASLCIGHSYQPLELQQFPSDHSVCAFFSEGARNHGNEEDSRMMPEVYQSSSYGEISPSTIEVGKNWMKTYPLVGRESQMSELRSYAANARVSNSPVISVWGIAGIGKSALVRNLYYDRMLHSEQFTKYCWVDVSRPFNLRDFCRSLLRDFRSQNDPIEECRKFLQVNQCLVVIDELESEEEWDQIKAVLVSRDSSSVIIVITTEACVATYCTNNEDQVCNVKGLEEAAAFHLFREEVRRTKSTSHLITHNSDELGELIFKCGGLPKVIVALAELLATQTVKLMDNIHSLNHKFMHHLETNQEYDSLQGLFSWMHSYFRNCPDSLKPCIFYLSIFPRDYNIRRRRLVRRWIAEGYSKDSDEISAEEKAEQFFSNLLQLSIIQQLPKVVTTVFDDTKMISCQVNGFIREYIVSRRMEENLVFELGHKCVMTTQHTGRHLIILKSWDRDRIVFDSIDFSRLRSLTVFGEWESFLISKRMRLLRVLDLEDATGVKDDDLRKMLKLLRRLKFLSLRGRTKICCLPNSLGDLRQLQSLDVRYTSIVTLPGTITKLKKLQYIRAGTTIPASTPDASTSLLPEFRRCRRLVGVVVPSRIGELTALHTLGVVNIGASGGKDIVKELNKLTQLRKLGVSGINKHNCEHFFADPGHVHLESLLVRLDKDSQSCLDGISLLWKKLRSLKLHGLQNKLPLLVAGQLSNLRKLDVEMDTLEKNDIELLAELPELCILRVRVKQLEGGKLHFYVEMYGEQLATFKQVKILEIGCSSSPSHVEFGSNSMQNLEVLKVDCYTASYQLTGLNFLPELKQVLLKGGTDDIKIDLETQLRDGHPRTAPAVELEK
ncbi:hypothetical protein CFC21_105823 [Triticum aestivum]|uniref:NB-ARC domain-containing protein n=2 Tax=Triticum aestivum TaxID=4565 RepID=A0A9R1N8X1_WHEAT|nr:disease resistance protein Pik-2-like [Triticum aestivum]KAF7104968.1 hypothetical protein CFC21_105823 [Triticum aestivum]